MRKSLIWLLRAAISILCIGIILSSCSILPFSEVLFSSKPAEDLRPDNVLFFDDFSSNSSGWDRLDTELGGTDYVDGQYQILVSEVHTDYFTTLYRNYSNIGIQVDAQRITGSFDNNYGLICRYQDEKNFYAGMVSSDGYYGIFKVKNGVYEVLGHQTMLFSDLILRDNLVNTLQFSCHDDFLLLYVNKELLDVQQDDTYSAGDVGMIAGSFTNAGVLIGFDNFYLFDTGASESE